MNIDDLADAELDRLLFDLRMCKKMTTHHVAQKKR